MVVILVVVIAGCKSSNRSGGNVVLLLLTLCSSVAVILLVMWMNACDRDGGHCGTGRWRGGGERGARCGVKSSHHWYNICVVGVVINP